MPVPTFDELGDPGLEMLKIARERLGGGYDGTTTVTSPISLKDLSNLSGGNSGGSGNSYAAINMLNVQSPAFSRNRRPDGNNPLKMSEFFGYNQNLQRRVVRFAYSNVVSQYKVLNIGMMAVILYQLVVIKYTQPKLVLHLHQRVFINYLILVVV